MTPTADRTSATERARLLAWPIGVVGYALLLLVAILWGIPQMQDDLARTSQTALDSRGFVGLEVEFDGRIGTVSGGEMTAARRVEVEETLGRINGVRRVQLQAPAAATTTLAAATPTTVVPSPTTSVARGTEASAISFERDVDDHVVLLGQVATDEQRDELFAAADAAGFSRVSDRIEVSDEVAVDNDRHQAILGLLSAVSLDVLPASLKLDGAVLSLSGESGRPDVETRLAEPLDELRKLGIDATVDVAEIDEDEQIVRLRDELAQILSLAARIEPEKSNFDAESSDLDVQDEVVLQRVGQAIRRFPLPSVAIIGHTDGAGPADENLVLSRMRAESVRDFLVRDEGVEDARLTTEGRGESEPVASNDTEDGRRANRRVQFVVKKKDA